MGREDAEIDAVFARNGLVVVCWEPGCPMHRLPHWEEQKWVPRPQRAGYRHYSHSICRAHFLSYEEEIERLYEGEMEGAVAAS